MKMINTPTPSPHVAMSVRGLLFSPGIQEERGSWASAFYTMVQGKWGVLAKFKADITHNF